MRSLALLRTRVWACVVRQVRDLAQTLGKGSLLQSCCAFGRNKGTATARAHPVLGDAWGCTGPHTLSTHTRHTDQRRRVTHAKAPRFKNRQLVCTTANERTKNTVVDAHRLKGNGAQRPGRTTVDEVDKGTKQPDQAYRASSPLSRKNKMSPGPPHRPRKQTHKKGEKHGGNASNPVKRTPRIQTLKSLTPL